LGFGATFVVVEGAALVVDVLAGAAVFDEAVLLDDDDEVDDVGTGFVPPATGAVGSSPPPRAVLTPPTTRSAPKPVRILCRLNQLPLAEAGEGAGAVDPSSTHTCHPGGGGPQAGSGCHP
jgi:hypothetical protein